MKTQTPLDQEILSKEQYVKEYSGDVIRVHKIREAVKRLKESIMKNGNLKNRIIKLDDGSYEEKNDPVLNEIVLDYIEEIFGEELCK